jgi:hypothetical protein
MSLAGSCPSVGPEALSWSGDEDGGTVYAITREISQCRVGLV